MGTNPVYATINGGGGGYSSLGNNYKPELPRLGPMWEVPDLGYTGKAPKPDPKPPAPKTLGTSGTKTTSSSSIQATATSKPTQNVGIPVGTGTINFDRVLDFLFDVYQVASNQFVELLTTAIKTTRGTEKRKAEMDSNLEIHAQNVVAIGTSNNPVIIPIEGITDKPTYVRTAVTEYGYMLEFYPLERGMQWDDLSEDLKKYLMEDRTWLLEKDVLMNPVNKLAFSDAKDWMLGVWVKINDFFEWLF